MLFFIDSADINAIKPLMKTGFVDGVTTNPSLLAKAGREFDVIKDIADIVSGPISAEVISETAKDMIAEGKKLAQIAPQVVVKLPLTFEGLEACHVLTSEGISTNVTLCFSANQALLAAKAGATFISPFIGRVDDLGDDGLNLIEEIRIIFDNYGFDTKILGASIRHPLHVALCAKVGADAVTMPPKVLEQMVHHPLTDIGLQKFKQDWNNK